MDLQKKTLIVLVTFLILAIALTGVFVTVLLLSNYQSLEQKYITNDLDRTISQIKNEEHTISAIDNDWAPWDDTYDFVIGKRPDYIERNINPDTFANLNLDFMIITNHEGEIVYSGAFDPANRTIIPVTTSLLQEINANRPLMNLTAPHAETTGILMHSDTPVLITSHPIVRTDFSGTPQGVMIMGRFLDQDEIGRLSSMTIPSIAFYRVIDPAISPSLQSALETPGTSMIIQPTDENTVAGYALMRDISGNPALVLEITEPRDIYREGTSTVFQFIVILLLSELTFGIVMIFFLDRIVLSRMQSLGLQVRRIGTGSNRSSRVEMDGSDELSELATEINRMLTDIEKTNSELLKTEMRFRELAENTSDVLFTMDTAGKVLYVTPSINRYGYLIEDLISQDFSCFVYTGDRTRVSLEFHRQVVECTPLVTTFRLVDKWGFFHWIETKSAINMDVFGKTTGINGVLRDFTDRKRAEESIMLANKKLNLLNNITRHDILNTITALLGCVDMANATKVPAEREELLGQIKELTRIIQRQIEFTRAYQSVGVNAPSWQNLGEVLNRVIVNFAGSRITLDDEIANVKVYADPLLEKVFYNLIDNAIRYGEHIRTVRFYYQISDVGLTLICEDDGIGIPDTEKVQIFEQGVGKNTGMGLFLTREILLITGITILENGRFGQGARFEMLIPNGAFRFIRETNDEKRV
ncbi:CHASE4 domain-containing protein [Methanoregula sp.]|uniref:CHASE4 domain-containing protein n=1 Tax=Methanoregula sp. TaxID=2052170 RepID=UPI00356798D3